MKRITVWHIGGEDVRLRIPLLEVLRRHGFAIGAVGSEPGQQFADAGIPYWSYPLRRGPSPLSDLTSWRHLHRLFRTHRPDIVHAFDTKPTYLVPSAGRRAGIPARVCTITGLGYLFSSSSLFARSLRPAYHYLQRRACQASSVTIFQNEDDRKYFLDRQMVEPGRDRLVRGSGVDCEELMKGLPDDGAMARLREELGLDGRRVVTMISRLVVQKGVRVFVDAAAEIRNRDRDVAFLLVGPYSAEARGAISPQEALGGRLDVRYLGARSDIAAILAVSDMCVLPSYYREGVPRVLLEAGAMGLPLIATDMPGCCDVVTDGWNGLLIPPRDASHLVSAIRRLLASAQERAEMGARSKTFVRDNFSLARVAEAYGGIYTTLMADLSRLEGHPDEARLAFQASSSPSGINSIL